jgi:hypothetical protein
MRGVNLSGKADSEAFHTTGNGGPKAFACPKDLR